MNIKFFACAIILSFFTVLIDITMGLSYVFILLTIGILSFAVSYYYDKYNTSLSKTNQLLNQTKTQFVENSEELAEAYKQLIEKDKTISNVADIVSSKISNSISIANSYLNLIKEEDLSHKELNLFIDKVLDETEKISFDTNELVKNLTGTETEVLYEQVNILELIKSVNKCAENKLKIKTKNIIEIPCDKESLGKSICGCLKLINGEVNVNFSILKTPKSLVSNEFVKITFTLENNLDLSDKEKEVIFATETARNTKKVVKALNEIRKVTDKHNGNFWILFNEKTLINITLPINPKFVS